MDLSKINVPNTAVVNLRGPDGVLLADDDGNGSSIVVYGPGSEQAQKFRRALSKELSEEAMRGGKTPKVNPDKLERRMIDRLVAHTAEVVNLSHNGEEITAGNIRKIYEAPEYGWLTQQVADRIGDWENFMLEG